MEEDARRKAELAAARAALAARIPTDQFFELPGRPTVVFQVRLWNMRSETRSPTDRHAHCPPKACGGICDILCVMNASQTLALRAMALIAAKLNSNEGGATKHDSSVPCCCANSTIRTHVQYRGRPQARCHGAPKQDT